MRITSIAGAGVLSFNQFRLALDSRLTFVVGPNGAGKSNLTRLLTICQRAVECADGGAGDVDRMLASFLAARHIHSESPAVEARVGVRITDPGEQALIVEYVRAMVTSAVTGQQQRQNIAEIDAWAEAEITEAKLQHLMAGEIVARHPGTQDGRWECWYEFEVPGNDDQPLTYRWLLLGFPSDTIVLAGETYTGQGVKDVVRQVTSGPVVGGMTAPVPGPFKFEALLPAPGEATTDCSFDMSRVVSGSQRRFAQMAGQSQISPGARQAKLATVLRAILRMTFRHTSDQRLLPSAGTSWSSSDLVLTSGAEGRLPEFLLRLKMGDPAGRALYQQLRKLFAEFTQGRACEVRLMQVAQPTGPDGESSSSATPPNFCPSGRPPTCRSCDWIAMPTVRHTPGRWQRIVASRWAGNSQPRATSVSRSWQGRLGRRSGRPGGRRDALRGGGHQPASAQHLCRGLRQPGQHP